MTGNTDTSTRAARIVWHACADESTWVEAAIGAIRDAVRIALDAEAETWLLLSGGSTPVPVLRALAQQDLEWPRIIVSLVDDRDVEPEADGSNARLLRENLLQQRAARARFEPLRKSGQSIDAAVSMSNARWHAPGALAGRHPSIAIAVLGMGDDGHTASLFPHAANLDAALASAEPYAPIDASGCPGAGAWPRRISLTPNGLAQAQQRLLLLRGADKRAVFEHALTAGAAHDAPIRVAVDMAGLPLRVEWCA